MNKKGFTLVELLAVIVLLGIVITLAATKGFGVFDTAKDKISEQNKKAVEEAAKLILVEVENCQDELNEYEELKEYFDKTKGNTAINTCKRLKDNINGSNIYLSDMKEKGIVTGNDLENIDGYVDVTYDTTNNKGSINSVNIVDETKSNTKTYTFVSKNQHKNSTTAQTTLTFTTKEVGLLSFEWELDSELNYDKLKVTLNSETLVNDISGLSKSGKITKNLTKNVKYTFKMEYKKDGSVHKDPDTATIKNLKISAPLDGEIKITDGTYKFEQQ